MKIKTVLLIMLLGFVSVETLYSQDDDLESLDFETEELEEEARVYFGVGAGVTYSFAFVNLDEMNSSLMASNSGFSEFKTPMQLFGYEGFVAIPWIKNLRFGYGAYGGNIIEEITPEEENYTSVSDLSLESYGGRFDYGIVIMSSLAILPGVSFSYGDLSYSQYQYTDNFDWSNLGSYSKENSMQKFSKNFLLITPSVSFEYAVETFLAVRINAGYNIELLETDWKLNDGAVVDNFPELKINSLNVQLGIFVGLFNY